MNRQKLLQQLEKAWSQVNESYRELSESEMIQPGVIGDWSIKDILGHITTWEEEALKYLPLILHDGRPPRYSVEYGGINAFNAKTVKKKSALSLSEILKQLEETHHRLTEYILSVPEAHLGSETRFRRRLRQDTYGHYPKHVKAIQQWRTFRSVAQD